MGECVVPAHSKKKLLFSRCGDPPTSRAARSTVYNLTNCSVRTPLFTFLLEYIHRLLHFYLDFQTWISLKWLQISMSFFLILKVLYSKLHLPLVSCKNLHQFLNGSLLKKTDPKIDFKDWAKIVDIQHFWEFWKNAKLWEAVLFKPLDLQ